MSEDIKRQIKEIIINKYRLGIDKDDFDETRPFFEYGVGIDSVANLELILEIEKKLKINIDEAQIDAEVLFNFKNLYNYLIKNI
ncbi:MAG: hypothetical protein GTN99_01510 [Candidatus Dadabacteria bacterium]|nr:hypothetical protein [Candidatus Dadabacteria bacterium]NIT12953.1 hypothetical protein [Candidatus Dadabacteria bacterium]